MERLLVSSAQRECMINVTAQVNALAAARRWKNGVLTIFCPHTTCGITVNEGFDPDVALDMTAFFRRLIPKDPSFRHGEGNSDAHIKASVIGSSVQVLIEEGRLLLGTWQAIWLFEGDGPRKRELWIKWQGD